MDLVQLEYFVRIAEQRSFTQAAMLLKASQPTLSRTIRALEVELKTNLFRRTGRGVQLTPGGRRFLDHARDVLQSAEAARQAVADPESRHSGRLVAGLPPSIGQALIPELVPRLAERFPGASISVVQGLSDTLAEQVSAGRLDFAVMRNPAPSPRVSIELIATEGVALLGAKPIGRPGSAVSLSDIATLPLILPTTSDFLRPLLEAAFAQQGMAPRIAFEIDSVPSIIALVAQRFGYAVIPATTRLAVPPGTSVHCQPVASALLRASLCMVSPARPPRSTLVREGARLCRALLEDLLAPILGSGVRK